MAHFAQIDSNNIVTKVLVLANELITIDGSEQESKGIEILTNLHGGTWVQTSRSLAFRKNWAGIGYTYNSELDAFIPPKPYNSWVLNESTCQWEAPVEHPSGEEKCEWDEDNQQWINCVIPIPIEI
tara:strand:- start:49 stop:426 length:378 start_codon:yes stop_codon:yes gene_type:complete